MDWWLRFLAFLKKKKKSLPNSGSMKTLPEVSLLIAAINEEEISVDKIQNSLASQIP